MARTHGSIGKPTKLNRLMQEKSMTIAALQEKLREVAVNIDGMYPAVGKNEIAILKSGAKDITTCSVYTVLKLAYALGCTPNDLIPNVKEGEYANW